MVTIHHLEVRLDVAADDEVAVFARLFNRYIEAWARQRETERAREKAAARASELTESRGSWEM
ncbi:putative phage tail protein [Streptomyces canus]|uniref:putative phage tail protein n=1 Tax=Streptomyces canus TaxID=58343 RepID=UPI0036982E6C